MYYYLYRFYDPNLQRWINRDPLKEQGGVNLFEFAANRPTVAVDPLGKNAIIICVACLAGVALIAEGCHMHECSRAQDRWQAAANTCRKEYDTASKTIDGEINFIDKYGGDGPGDAIFRCAKKKDPGALDEMVKKCSKVAVNSQVHGSIPELPLENPVH
jgi:hypothetical protein